MGLIFNRRPRGGAGAYNHRYDSRTMIPRYTSPPDRNTQEWLEEFGKNPRLAVVDRIASDLSFLSGKLYRVDRNGEEIEVTSHPFLDFWDNPNPLHEMSASAIWRLQQIYLDMKGEGYFLMERDVLGRPAELWPIPTHWVLMVPYINYPFYSLRLGDGTVAQVPVEDVFVMRELHPLNPYRRGLGKSEPLADEIETDEYAAKFQKKFFYNDATPNLLLKMPGSTEPQRKRFMADWKERLQGVFKSHGVAAVNGDVEAIKLGENMKDLDMVNGRVFLRNAVLEHFGMPREIMGITESSNRATSDAAQFIYAQNVLTPRKNQRENAINQQIMPYFGDDLVWRFDEIIPRNQEFDKAVAMEGWNSGLLTRNRALELLGQPPVDNGNVYKTQFSDVFVEESEDPAAVSDDMAHLQFDDNYSQPAEAGDDQDDKTVEVEKSVIEITEPRPEKWVRPKRELKTKRVRGYQRSLMQARKAQERRFELATVNYFTEQEKRIQAALGSSGKASGDVWDIVKDYIPTYAVENGTIIALEQYEIERLAADFVLELIDWEGEAAKLEDVFRPLWAESYEKGAKVAKQAYGMAIDCPRLISMERLRTKDRVKAIEDTTAESLGKIVAKGIKEGQTREKMAEAIMQEMNTGKGRARVIAQNETHTSLMTGNFDMMKAGKIATKTWVAVGDGATRGTHRKMNGQTVPIDTPFTSSSGARLMFPGDPDCTDPSETVGCRCDMVAGDF